MTRPELFALQGQHADGAKTIPFHAICDELPPKDVQYLMAYPFFSLSKRRRVKPINYRSGAVAIRVEAVEAHGMATIWDADILIWAASQFAEADRRKLRVSRLIVVTPYRLLSFIGRGKSARDYQRLKAALDRLQSTTITTSIRQGAGARNHRFSWVSEWREIVGLNGKPVAMEITLADWFYQLAMDKTAILTLDDRYFTLKGGLERWLYRLVRKHGGNQKGGWKFDFAHLYRKSASQSPFRRFSYELKQIVKRQSLPGYRLSIKTVGSQADLVLVFEPLSGCGKAVNSVVLSGTPGVVLSGTPLSCYQERKSRLSKENTTENRARNIESNIITNFNARARSVENLARDTANAMRAFPETHRGKRHG